MDATLKLYRTKQSNHAKDHHTKCDSARNSSSSDYAVQWVRPTGDGLRIVEEVAGISLYDVFGFEHGVHSVTIASENAQRVARVFGQEGVELTKILDAFFTGKDNVLSDVMDLLDRAKVPYAYEAMQKSTDPQV